MSKNISAQRKSLYYIGLGILIIGVLMLLSSFFMMNTGETSFSQGSPAFLKRALIAIIYIIVGTFLNRIGARPVASSSPASDSQKTKENLQVIDPVTIASDDTDVNDGVDGADVTDDTDDTDVADDMKDPILDEADWIVRIDNDGVN